MNDLDELDLDDLEVLRARFVRLADPSPAPDPMDVFAAAARHGHRRRVPILALAAVAVLLAGVLAWRAWPERHPVTVGPSDTTDDSGTSVPDVVLRHGGITGLTMAFGRTWVSTGDTSTVISVFDTATGRSLGDVTTADGTALPGNVLSMVATDGALWVRLSIMDRTTETGSNMVMRIDPQTLVATRNRILSSDGPLAAFGDRFVDSDWQHLEIIREDGVELAVPSMDTVMGISPATLPGTVGLIDMYMDAGGVWALHQGRAEVIRVDPDSGATVAHAKLDSSEPGPMPPAGTRIWWISNGQFTGTRSDMTILRGVELDEPGLVLTSVRLPDGKKFIGQLTDDVVVRSTEDGSTMELLDLRTGATVTVPAPTAPRRYDLTIVWRDDEPFLGVADDKASPMTLSFISLRPYLAGLG